MTAEKIEEASYALLELAVLKHGRHFWPLTAQSLQFRQNSWLQIFISLCSTTVWRASQAIYSVTVQRDTYPHGSCLRCYCIKKAHSIYISVKVKCCTTSILLFAM